MGACVWTCIMLPSTWLLFIVTWLTGTWLPGTWLPLLFSVMPSGCRSRAHYVYGICLPGVDLGGRRGSGVHLH